MKDITQLSRADVEAIMATLPAGKKVVPVSHENPDDDEYLALWIIETWGTDLFPGVSERPIHVLDAGLRLSNGQSGDSWLPGYVCVGLGGGVFDEHGKGDGKSAASMAADFFGITDDKALKPTLAYSLRADDKAKDHPFNMATVIKNLHANKTGREVIRTMYRRWADSLYLRFDGQLVIDDAPRATFQRMAIAWLAARFAPAKNRGEVMKWATFADAMEAAGLTAPQHDDAREIQRFADRDLTKGALTDFDAGGIVRAMQATGVPEVVIMEDVFRILDAKVKVQRDYMAAEGYFREKAAYVSDVPVKVAVVRSDNEQMSRASRTVDAGIAVLIQRRSSGHIRIFGDQKRDLRPILGRLRAMERRRHGMTDRLTWHELTEGGTMESVPEWYGFAKYGKVLHVFNSTIKAPHTRRTRLTLDDVVKAVRDGLSYAHKARGRRRAKKTTAVPPNSDTAVQ